MNSITIEEPGLDTHKVGTLEAPSGGAGWFSPPKALARKRSAAAASRLADRRKSIVAPLQSTARYKLDPLALDPDVGFVHSPTVVGRSEPRAQRSFRFWGIPLDPTLHRDAVGLQASLGKQLLDVPIRQGETQIPTNRQKDDFRFELPPLEQTGNRDPSSIGPAYQTTPAKLQHCYFNCISGGLGPWICSDMASASPGKDRKQRSLRRHRQ